MYKALPLRRHIKGISVSIQHLYGVFKILGDSHIYFYRSNQACPDCTVPALKEISHGSPLDIDEHN